MGTAGPALNICCGAEMRVGFQEFVPSLGTPRKHFSRGILSGHPHPWEFSQSLCTRRFVLSVIPKRGRSVGRRSTQMSAQAQEHQRAQKSASTYHLQTTSFGNSECRNNINYYGQQVNSSGISKLKFQLQLQHPSSKIMI